LFEKGKTMIAEISEAMARRIGELDAAEAVRERDQLLNELEVATWDANAAGGVGTR
jgi:hypothetical protein